MSCTDLTIIRISVASSTRRYFLYYDTCLGPTLHSLTIYHLSSDREDLLKDPRNADVNHVEVTRAGDHGLSLSLSYHGLITTPTRRDDPNDGCGSNSSCVRRLVVPPHPSLLTIYSSLLPPFPLHFHLPSLFPDRLI